MVPCEALFFLMLLPLAPTVVVIFELVLLVLLFVKRIFVKKDREGETPEDRNFFWGLD